MRTFLSLLPAAFLLPAAARFLHSIPEDTYALPKSRVIFLNSLPLLNEQAQKWLKDGLRGGHLEFLDQPWKENNWPSHSSRKEIDSGKPPSDDISMTDPLSLAADDYTLEHMKIGPNESYLCLIPKPTVNLPSSSEEDIPDSEMTPGRSWSLLQPLSGTCLYHRQGWFTYSYCHNEQIRQFKEAVQSNPHISGGYKPEEDPEWESYTLGKAPKPGADLTLAEQDAHAANLELARIAGSRYLVQRWGDGTMCDKTGKSREVEVQFHCSMTMTDTILFVKEAKTCSYVLVVHTPRLCGEPGFKSRRERSEESLIRCREIVQSMPDLQANIPDADHPLKVPSQKTVSPPPSKDKPIDTEQKDKLYNELLRKTLEAIMASKDGKLQPEMVAIQELSDDKQVIVEILDEDSMTEGQAEALEKLRDALRTAGYDVEVEGNGDSRKEDEQNKRSLN
ncbi:hypothetical protein L208DRAFT_1362367 [Tricholoma matsutake]|nr:hypothetical protein L208DRAFT_1362367 [Tricholoma matsutake 945]